MRLINRQSFSRWIHWFWITTGIISSFQPHVLHSQETNSSSFFTTTRPVSSSSAEMGNISVSHTISVVSVLYSSDESNEKSLEQGSTTTISPVQKLNATSIPSDQAYSTTTHSPTTLRGDLDVEEISNTTAPREATTISSTTTSNPQERHRGGKEGRSLVVHAPVVVRVFEEEGEDMKNATGNVSSIEVFSESTFILREKESTLLELGESHGSLLTLKDQNPSGGNDEPSVESTASGISTNTLIGIIMGILVLMIIGTVGFGVLIYHEKFANKPQTLDDNYANSDSGGIYNFSTTEDFFRRISHIECGGFDIGRDTYSEEMYNLDNDSFLNSLEAMTFPSYSPDMNNRSTFSNDSGV